MSKADLDKQPAQVAAMFDEVSTHYDRTNTVLSVGNASLWRVATTRAVGPRAGERILDVAAGTGTSSASLARNGASVVAADFSEGMIEVGRRRQADNPYVTFVQADATRLPFEDESFDAVTISFGLRNIVDPRAALAEFYRVTKPGGRVVICEFSHPPVALIRAGYSAYLKYGMPVLARLASSNPAAYEYLMDSIQAWPAQPELATWLRDAGYESVAWRNLTAGIVALHRGRKPVRAQAAPIEAAPVVDEPAAAKPAAAKTAAAKPTAAKTAAAKPAAAKTPAAKPAAAKTPAAKPAAAKPAAAKPAAKPAAAKPEPAKPTAAKPAAAKPPAAKKTTTAAKPTAPAKPAADGTSSTPSVPSKGE
ncbi:demethylmenaquinone methyltransferase [Leifsonia aquatica]|uniref:demethylmenaquinone methyltransferase n=1 Tax=Leifsonia aquatica TaxID=144185 RepID=UPI00046A1C2D|nr:demethylmenaquinone methyltransferase [Leifsonia aquatica]